MIKKVVNLTEKSFENYTGPEKEFGKVNLFFGYNGQGKSSLANGIFREVSDGKNTMFFNNEYVKRNLVLENNDKIINGVNAVFGQKNIEDLDELNSKMISDSDLETDKKLISDTILSIIERTNDIFDSKKGSLKIKRKIADNKINNVNVTELKQILEYYYNDVKVAKKIQSDDSKLINYVGDNSLNDKLELVQELAINDFTVSISESDIEKLYEIFRKTYNDISIPSSTIVGWIEEGVSLHTNEKKCQFCGNKIDLNQINKKVEMYKKNEKQKDAMFLKSKINRQIKESLSNFESFKSGHLKQYRSLIVREVTTFEEEIHNCEQHISKLESLSALIEEKNTNMNNKFENVDFLKSIESLKEVKKEVNSFYEKLINKKSENINSLSLEINNQDKLVKGSIGLEIQQDNFINRELSDLDRLIEEYKAKLEHNNSVTEDINLLMSQQSNYNDFKDLLNLVFIDLGLNFKLEFSSDEKRENYILKHSHSSEQLTVSKISEGERNLVGLVFYYFQLFAYEANEGDELNVNFKDEIEYVIIDDPVSSLDDNNKFYILEMISRLYKENAQIFIFTHVWNDFVQLSRSLNMNNNNGRSDKLFEIIKDAKGKSSLLGTYKPVSSYRKLFYSLFHFTKKYNSRTIHTFDKLHIVPNTMRRIFEEFLHFKNGEPLIPQKSNQPIIESMYEASSDENSMSHNKNLKLGSLLTIINALSHSNADNPKEILKSATFLMNFIKEMDPVHFNKMTSDLPK